MNVSKNIALSRQLLCQAGAIVSWRWWAAQCFSGTEVRRSEEGDRAALFFGPGHNVKSLFCMAHLIRLQLVMLFSSPQQYPLSLDRFPGLFGAIPGMGQALPISRDPTVRAGHSLPLGEGPVPLQVSLRSISRKTPMGGLCARDARDLNDEGHLGGADGHGRTSPHCRRSYRNTGQQAIGSWDELVRREI